MPGLIDGQLRAVWQADCRKKPPALIGDIPCHFGSPAPQLGESGLDVVTHEVELVMALTVSWMNSELGRGQSENKPASPRVCRRHAEYVCEERTDLLSFRGEDDCMQSSNHSAILAAAQGSDASPRIPKGALAPNRRQRRMRHRFQASFRRVLISPAGDQGSGNPALAISRGSPNGRPVCPSTAVTSWPRGADSAWVSGGMRVGHLGRRLRP